MHDVVSCTTFVGSALLTLLVGLIAHRFRRGSCLWPLLTVAFVGRLNPSVGAVSIFLPLEQSALSRTVSAEGWTGLCARYSFIGSLSAASRSGVDQRQALQGAVTMGVPTRASYVMVLQPAERPAAASVTVVPRSLGSAVGPLLAGHSLPPERSRECTTWHCLRCSRT